MDFVAQTVICII